MTKEEALGEFLNGFEGSQGNRDGRVTLDEFIKYYEEVHWRDGDRAHCRTRRAHQSRSGSVPLLSAGAMRP